MTVTIEFAPGTANEQTISLSADASQLNPVRTHTGVSDVRGTIKGDRSLEQYAKRQDRINIKSDGETIWTGYCVGISHNIQSGQTSISGDGIGKRLEETKPDYESIGGPVTYQNIALHDALRDYWTRTPFDNVTVTDQNTELVTEDEQIQSADTNSEWDTVAGDAASNEELITIQNGQVELAQTCWVWEGESGTSDSPVTSDDYSGGEAARFISSNQSTTYTFTPDYTVPSDAATVNVRLVPDDDVSTSIGYDVFLNGSQVASSGSFGSSLNLDWYSVDLSTSLDAGTEYTIEIQGQDGEEGGLDVDVCAVFDERFSYNFDNSVHEPAGYLDGPELYPVGRTIQLDPITTSFNISAADISSTWNGIANNQIRVTNDNGSSFESGSDTDTLSGDFDSPGREIFVEFTLDGFGSRDTATPREGYQGHAIDSYNLSIDGNNLVVIADMELSRNHFDNLKTLHEYGDFLWVIEHDDGPISDMAVSSFRRGEETRAAPDGFENQKNQRPEIQSGAYFNSVYLEGAKREDGTRPTSTRKNQEAINNDGREISPGVLRDTTITTEAGADFRAQALLDAALSNNDLVGSVTVPPVVVAPRFARPVDFGPGEDYKTVEKISLNLSQNNAEATFDFSSRTGLVEDIESLKRDTKGIGNQV